MNYQPSAIDNFTPSTPRFWSCMEAAASAVAEIRSVVVVVGGAAFHCLYPLQSHRAGGLESLLSMEYIWPKHPMVVVGVATK